MLELAARNEGESVREYISRTVIENIVNCTLSPGEQIFDDEIARVFSVSRTPVREVLLDLSERKLVDIRSKRGTYISLIDLSLVEEIRHLRAVLEAEVARVACSVLTQDDLDVLSENLSVWKMYIERGDTKRIMQYDKSFHKTLYLRSGFSHWYTLVESYAPHFDRTTTLSFRLLPKDKIERDHYELVEAIRKHQSENAAYIAHHHMDRYLENIEYMKKEYSGYFKG